MHKTISRRHPDTKPGEILIGYFDVNNVSQMKYSSKRISEERIFSNGHPIHDKNIAPVFVLREEYEAFIRKV